jgi:hypothetical protein
MNEDEPTNCYALSTESKLSRFWRWLLKAYWKHTDIPDPKNYVLNPCCEGHTYATDCIVNRVEIQMDWKDKLRVILGCAFHVHILTYCENKPGKIRSETTTFASYPPSPRESVR